MITCIHCGAYNIDGEISCSSCFKILTPVAPPPVAPLSRAAEPVSTPESAPAAAGFEALRAQITDPSFMERLQLQQQKRQADILFVFDCTGSMQPQIDGLKETIIEFADSIKADGVRARVGLIEYRDRLIDEEQIVHRFEGEVFTDDPARFREVVSALKASGGGDEPESAYDALLEATRQPFRSEGQRVIVLITDAPPHHKDREVKSVETLIEAFRKLPLHQFYPVVNTSDPHFAQNYLKLYESGCKGMAFHLGSGQGKDDFKQRAEHFKRTLMQLGKTISTATR
jgi:hypothetical protein